MVVRKKIDRGCVKSRKLSLNPRDSETPKEMDVRNNSRISGSVQKKNTSLNRSSIRSKRDDENVINVSELFSGHLKVFRVSPIYNFQMNKISIYQRKMKEMLAALNYRKEDLICNCEFQYRKLDLDEKIDVIQVSVSLNNKKCIAYFLSTTGYQQSGGNSAISHFPISLVKGAGIVVTQLNDTFCKFFDCDIHPVAFPIRPLLKFFSCISQNYVSKVTDQTPSDVVVLYYKIPGYPPTYSIQLMLQLDAVVATCVAYNVESTEPDKDLQIYNGILKLLHNVYSCDFSLAELYQIKFPCFSVSSSGLIKFSSEDAVKSTLSIIEGFANLNYIANPGSIPD